VSLVVIFAYFLALTVFILDITYALVDPRVSIENKNQAIRITSRKRWGRFCFRLPRKSKSPRAHRRTWAIRSDAPYFTPKRARASFSGQVKALWKRTRDLKPVLREIARYPSAMIGLTIIAIFVAVSLYTVIAIPHGKAIRLWRGDENVWARNPKMAQPEWINFFRKEKLPPTIVLDSRDGASGVVRKSVAPFAEGMNEITLSFPIDFTYSTFPQNLVVYFEAQYDEKMPLLTLTWLTPDGREIELWTSTIIASQEYHLALDKRLQRKLDEHLLERALFGDPNAETSTPLQGTYELRASALVFEEEADLDAEVVLYGQVYGLAGTDDKRRDLMVALLWGVPVALAFGLVAAVGTSVSSMVIAAIGAWFGGWADGLIQRITEVNMILPFFPVSLMIYLMYSKSLWAILGVTVLLSIFGNAIKNYRAIFIQLREAPYIEAAQAYGADNWRIIFRYLIPRIVAVWIPQFVTLVPSYVFLEATLAYLRVSDPVLPTWGKLIHLGRMDGPYHLVPLLIGLLLLIGGAFVLVGLALERMFEPRLREM
jgi:peptide/nickel transport system permease protein